MTAPLGLDLDLQIAMVTALKASANLTSLVGSGKILDDNAGDVTLPYIVVGLGSSADASNQCQTARQIAPVVHVWSSGKASGKKGWREAKQISAAIIAALHNVTLTLTENTCFSILFDRDDTIPDPDGVTKHIAITFSARVEQGA